jgi:hypothetical protein
MAAAPKSGTLMARGVSGTTYAIDVYLSDVANAAANFDSGNGAGTGSLNFWKSPERVVIYDFSIPTGLTDTTNGIFTSDGSQIPKITIRWANFINTLATRPTLQIGVEKGSQLGMVQRA